MNKYQRELNLISEHLAIEDFENIHKLVSLHRPKKVSGINGWCPRCSGIVFGSDGDVCLGTEYKTCGQKLDWSIIND